jgi:hypothetical protein
MILESSFFIFQLLLREGYMRVFPLVPYVVPKSVEAFCQSSTCLVSSSRVECRSTRAYGLASFDSC